jgi:hypothetical protein
VVTCGGAMPPAKRKKAEAGSSILAAPVLLGRADEADARRERAAQKVQDRSDRLNFTRDMNKFARQLLQEAGFRSLSTEGAGDCWLICMLADTLPREQLEKFTQKERSSILTPVRKDILDFATSVQGVSKAPPHGKQISKDCFRTLCNWLLITVPDADAADAIYSTAARSVERKLRQWLRPCHYGQWQQVMHTLAGWFLKKNVLELGYSMVMSDSAAARLNLRAADARTQGLVGARISFAQRRCMCGRSWARTVSPCRSKASMTAGTGGSPTLW